MAKLEVNQSAQNKDDSPVYGNSAEMSEVKQVKKLLNEGKSARKKYDSNWDKYWDKLKKIGIKLVPPLNRSQLIEKLTIEAWNDFKRGFKIK